MVPFHSVENNKIYTCYMLHFSFTVSDILTCQMILENEGQAQGQGQGQGQSQSQGQGRAIAMGLLEGKYQNPQTSYFNLFLYARCHCFRAGSI